MTLLTSLGWNDFKKCLEIEFILKEIFARRKISSKKMNEICQKCQKGIDF